MVSKAFLQGFFWLTAKADADRLVEKCTGCQLYARQPKVPAEELKTIPITWPFAVWGLDMVGPFKTAPSGFTDMLVAVDKFTKWNEAKPIRSLDGIPPRNSCGTLWLGMESPTASSPTTAAISLKETSKHTGENKGSA